MTNIDVARAYAKNYYGAPTATSGPAGRGRAAEPGQQLRERGALGRREGRELADRAHEGAEPGDRARRRRHDTDHLELRALQQLGLQPDHECHLRRPDGQHVHREHVPGHAGDARPGQPGQGPGLRDLLDHRAGRFAARRDDRQPGERLRGRATGHRHGDPQREDGPGGRRRLPAADAGRHRPRRLHRRPVHQAAGRLVPGVPRHARVLRAVHPRDSRRRPVRPSSTSPGRAPTSSRRATTSSPTSATSSAISRAASRTRRSRCRTRTTTSRRPEPERRTRSEISRSPFATPRPRGSGPTGGSALELF